MDNLSPQAEAKDMELAATPPPFTFSRKQGMILALILSER